MKKTTRRLVTKALVTLAVGVVVVGTAVLARWLAGEAVGEVVGMFLGATAAIGLLAN